MVNGRNYVKRCRECWHSESYSLPELDKKVIYLDQFVISNMMKAVNSRLSKNDRVDEFFIQLFEKISKLCKLQVLVCPDSEFHENESSLSPFSAELKRMYEHLSNGITLYDSATIRRFELCHTFAKINKYKLRKDNLTIDDILHGNKNEWQGRLLFSIDHNVDQEEITRRRQSREAVAANINKLFGIWRKEPNKQYEDWYKAELDSFGLGIFTRYAKNMMNLKLARAGEEDSSALFLETANSDEHILIISLLHYLPNDMDEGAKYDLVFKFLFSEDIKKLPCVRIMAALFASLEHEVVHGGRKKLVGNGMGSDIYMVSSVLPYCDAIFVDNEINRFLSHPRAKYYLSEYEGKVFSLSSKQAFLDYLDEMIDSVPQKHKNLINEIYGNHWTEAFYEMYSY